MIIYFISCYCDACFTVSTSLGRKSREEVEEMVRDVGRVIDESVYRMYDAVDLLLDRFEVGPERYRFAMMRRVIQAAMLGRASSSWFEAAKFYKAVRGIVLEDELINEYEFIYDGVWRKTQAEELMDRIIATMYSESLDLRNMRELWWRIGSEKKRYKT